MDQYLVEEANKENAMHGCTCVCSLVLDDVVYFANIGDSEGILISVENGVVIPKNMTKAHKANEPSEKERIESLGGHVFFGRLYGSLAVSRSFGDALYKRPKTSKDFVSWEPYTIIDTLTPNHKYMVLACDGLFDVMNHQEVADMTHKLFSEGQDSATVAKSLVEKAINDLATEDNVTVIIIKIEWDDVHHHQPKDNSQTAHSEHVHVEEKHEHQHEPGSTAHPEHEKHEHQHEQHQDEHHHEHPHEHHHEHHHEHDEKHEHHHEHHHEHDEKHEHHQHDEKHEHHQHDEKHEHHQHDEKHHDEQHHEKNEHQQTEDPHSSDPNKV